MEQLRGVLSQHSGVRLALPFGSVAREQARDDSDVDVALDVPRTSIRWRWLRS